MSTKRKTYSNEFKTKVVLEVLENNATINEIASKYNILPKSIQQWKKQFLENALLVFEEAVSVKKIQRTGKGKRKANRRSAKSFRQSYYREGLDIKKSKELGIE